MLPGTCGDGDGGGGGGGWGGGVALLLLLLIWGSGCGDRACWCFVFFFFSLLVLSYLCPCFCCFLHRCFFFLASVCSALSRFGILYVMTHDSIGLGEDGPTHQPVEVMELMRATPNMHAFRPADGNEVRQSR